jgi:hypothetical protein
LPLLAAVVSRVRTAEVADFSVSKTPLGDSVVVSVSVSQHSGDPGIQATPVTAGVKRISSFFYLAS